MELHYDESQLAGKYDERNLVCSKSGKYKYPSKKMFVEFLKQYEDIDGNVDIWSIENGEEGSVTIKVELKYFAKSL